MSSHFYLMPRGIYSVVKLLSKFGFGQNKENPMELT